MRFFYRCNAISFIATVALYISAGSAFSQSTADASLALKALAPFADEAGRGLKDDWLLSGLPGDKIALSRFEPTTDQGEPALRVSTQNSYGVLTHVWRGPAPAELRWRWQLAQPLLQADIITKSGDDTALKICVMFDQPLADIPFFQRAALTLARSSTGWALPSATLGYLWDSRYPAGTSGANPYSARVRYKVLNGVESKAGQWVVHSRRIAEDFAELFGTERKLLPPVIAVAIGADSDNTHGTSVAYISGLRWQP